MIAFSDAKSIITTLAAENFDQLRGLAISLGSDLATSAALLLPYTHAGKLSGALLAALGEKAAPPLLTPGRYFSHYSALRPYLARKYDTLRCVLHYERENNILQRALPTALVRILRAKYHNNDVLSINNDLI